MQMKNKRQAEIPAAPDRIRSYFRAEWLPLSVVAVTGILYNIGMTAGPWFEGQLAQMLCDVIGAGRTAADMLALAVHYLLVILLVQALRYAKRFYVRRFANNVSRAMKHVLYRNLVHKSRAALSDESVGTLMTKAISDVDTCAEGMRKFTTEIFDTGVVMAAYLVMLFVYDWRLALLSCIFPPFAYLIAEKLKHPVTRCAAACRESAGRLSGETLDRVSGALTYRVLGEEGARDAAYEERLADYEKKAVRAGVLETTMQPLYGIVSMASVVLIVWFGARNVRGVGFTAWDIAAFTTFLSCFAKLAIKSSKAAKLFNAVQKARVSWNRIRPLMAALPADAPARVPTPAVLRVKELSFAYPGGKPVLDRVSFSAAPGEIVGVTGQIACGKSTLGGVFLGELAYSGSVRYGEWELSEMPDELRCGTVGYMGHDPELMSDTIEENILLGDTGDVSGVLRAVCMDGEIARMPEGVRTRIGSGGVRLSGGQQARIALARTLYHRKPLLVLDDPFSALDRETERQIFENLREAAGDSTVLLLSHRLCLFPSLDRVLFLENGRVTAGTHAELLQGQPTYLTLYERQAGGEEDEN